MPRIGTVLRYLCRSKNSKDMIAKKNIIPVGFNAEQCKRGVLSFFADDIITEWMSDQDFVQQYLYC